MIEIPTPIYEVAVPYDENYLIYSDGRVYSIRSGIFLKPQKQARIKERQHEQPYFTVRLYRKNYYIHRLVAEKFCDNPHNFNEINHIDENRQNNDYTNLEWVSSRKNKIHSSKAVCGYVGVYEYPSKENRDKRYMARAKNNGKTVYLGTFFTPEEAHLTYIHYVRRLDPDIV